MTGVEVSAAHVRSRGLPSGTRSSEMLLELPAGLSFSEWKRVGEMLAATAERVAWSVGDWRAYGDRFRDEHSEGLAAVDRRDRRAFEAAAVSRAYPGTPEGEERQVGERMPGVSWYHHERILRSVKVAAARETWLNEVLRHGWPVRELEDRLVEGRISGPRPLALSVRATGPVVERFGRRAEALGVPARDLALEVLELASQLDDPVGVLEAAGATRAIGAAA